MCVEKKDKIIAFVCAMHMEIEALSACMDNVCTKKLGYMDIVEGTLAGRKCVAARSGVGKVNAAMSTTMLINHYNVETLINVGVSGGLLEEQNVGDIVISKNVIEHDFDTSPLDGENGYGYKSECDETLILKCEEVLKALNIPYYIGDTASGDVFVTKDMYLPRIKKLFPHCLNAEMEAGAVAHVCQNAGVPALIIRSLSDITVKEGNSVDFMTFAQSASVRAAEVAKEIIKKL